MPKFKLNASLLIQCKNFDTDVLLDKPEDYLGAPISVQLVCRRFREEECIGLASVIAEALKAS
jgi:hypothetical protein